MASFESSQFLKYLEEVDDDNVKPGDFFEKIELPVVTVDSSGTPPSTSTRSAGSRFASSEPVSMPKIYKMGSILDMSEPKQQKMDSGPALESRIPEEKGGCFAFLKCCFGQSKKQSRDRELQNPESADYTLLPEE